jgi:anaerobic selenocysteine-containing dehydrogenase
MEHRANGAMTFRTIACLPGLTGAWRERGGGLLYMTFDLFAAALVDVGMPKLEDTSIRSINMVQIGQALTNINLDPPIRALVVYNSNPATIAPNQNLVKQGLKRDDLFCIVLEHFMTDTARYADYVFPSTTQVEHLDVMGSWGSRYVSLNLPAARPAGEAVSNMEFFRRLAKRLGLTEPYLYETDEQLARKVLASGHPYVKGITTSGWLTKVGRPSIYLNRGCRLRKVTSRPCRADASFTRRSWQRWAKIRCRDIFQRARVAKSIR